VDVDFVCDPGDVLALFGPSGSGKTTILRSIAGLHRPQDALIQSGTQTWVDTAHAVFVPPHRRSVGFVFQEYALFPHLTAAGNVVAALGHRPRAERQDRAAALLRMVHLADRTSRRPHELSGGERQRVAIARALARDPAVLLLDEPFAAVDRPVRRRLQAEIDELRRAIATPIVLVTHDFDDVVRLATRVLVIERGSMVASGDITTLMSHPSLPWLGEGFTLGAVFDAVVSRLMADRGLVELAFDGGTLLATHASASSGSTVRVRVPAREVILATRRPDGLSLHNVLAGTVARIHAESGSDHAVVQVAVGRLLILAEVTRDAVSRLDLAVGRDVYALIKSVSIETLTVRPVHGDAIRA
jgi:molybdate transport system ATP-binding protein